MSAFLQKVVAVIEGNLADENFGVSELSEQINMSRSNLLRKVKQETGESVSILIRNVRLHNAKHLLKDDALTISEIAYQVGFSSTSYFTKCFRELYGYTPGEEGNRAKQEETQEVVENSRSPQHKKSKITALVIAVAALVAAILWLLPNDEQEIAAKPIKSIAVLPFKNDSADTTNIYFMNGLMEAILDNFQKIEAIKVTSRTTVEKYRNVDITIPELSKELNVSYFIEGSGQKIGDEILLTIQLIEAPSDKHLWSKRYKRQLKDVFDLQSEVAKSIASEINAIITPEEQKRIEKIPTHNLVAYDYYLKGLALLNDKTGTGLAEGVEQFKKAIQEDGQFANAYAYVAISYYYLDIFMAEPKYTEELKNYADKAMMIDAEAGESLIARSLYYMQIRDFTKAVESFEEVLEYYPNTAWIHNFLSNIYGVILPDTEKYLTHALQGIPAAVEGTDSVTASFTYLHLSNALAQTGFIRESETYVQKSLAYNPDNVYSQCLYVYIKQAQNFDLKRAELSLKEILKQDTTSIFVIEEIAKVCYTSGAYEEAWVYYDKMLNIKRALHLDIFQNEDASIGFVLEQLGRKEEAKKFYESFLAYTEKDQSLYKDILYSNYYAVTGNIDQAIKHLKAFSEQDNYQYWIVLFMDKDPITLLMKGHPDYESTIQKINDKFWANNKKIRKMLEEENIIQPMKRDL
ncbi:helix-turn-helix domain-containing protein [Reichenbachiella agarivorans]|uniref:Helix-turn-helix domain-containing protein n=1 Tax=Reichenbachiella agarivorans TaxID=2979464 RepID=A0ABY6CQK6_9BACT|nr:helix-turn-helix domain-containing protein [Reichenbachiella agarivorans]UXP32320.1 helix-turn-helix domain-containing protein [Reichenbachiella agarivorans]